jgi:hypothetical protein
VRRKRFAAARLVFIFDMIDSYDPSPPKRVTRHAGAGGRDL